MQKEKEQAWQYHRRPETWGDRVALALVLTARWIADVFFAKRYGHRAVVLETVAAVPGMVGALFQHLKALRWIRDDKGRIRALEEEAENERMHLMVYVSLAEPSVFERLLVMLSQAVFFTGYFVVYLFSPKTGHRIVGYLEEEAVRSYSSFLEEIESGRHANPPAPELAIRYWGLPADAQLREVVLATREDEIGHRDRNHALSDEVAREEGGLLHPRAMFLVIFFLCLVLLTTGYVLQYAVGLVPCKLCIVQRFFFLMVGLTALAAALHRPGTFGVKAYGLGVTVWALLGGAVALRQIWLQHHPPVSLLGTDCASWLGSLNEVIVSVFQATADCAERGWTMLGLSIPEWSLLAFVFLALLGIAQWRRAS
jgi:ubiquinol oxidase